MNIGGGEAADQLVRMMLSGGEVAVRLTGSAVKNLLAISLALHKEYRRQRQMCIRDRNCSMRPSKTPEIPMTPKAW